VFVTLVNLLAQGLVALLTTELLPVLVFLATLLPLYLITGGLLGYLVRRMLEAWNDRRLTQVSSRRETEKADSERRRAIYDLISTLSASLNYQRVLDTALDMSARGLAGQNGPEDRLVSAVLLYTPAETGGTELRVGSARRFTPADLRIALPGTSGLIGRAIDEGESRLARNLVKDPELGRVIALRACQSAYCLPLRSGLETYGILLFAHPEEEYFTRPREIWILKPGYDFIRTTLSRFGAVRAHDEIQEEARKNWRDRTTAPPNGGRSPWPTCPPLMDRDHGRRKSFSKSKTARARPRNPPHAVYAAPARARISRADRRP
jgi:hypothetical protein